MTGKSKHIIPARLMAFGFMVASAWQVLAVDPVVSNVQAKQREGSRLVDITYDVADPDSPTLTVYLKVSADGGTTWKGPVELVSGDVGRGIVPGKGKQVVWDAGKEIGPNQFGGQYRYRIVASDQWLADPGMVFVPAGPFQMGDNRINSATPIHHVIVSAFAMDRWEVSIELWESVRMWGNAHGYDLVAGGSDGAKQPIHTVNWYDVLKWNNARSEKEGTVLPAYYEDAAMKVVYRTGEKVPEGVKWDAGYRLPTEAEWEKAARGGVDGKFYPWGTDEINPTLANYRESNKGGTTPIGSYAANGYGIYDMAGNVWEMCWDWYGGYSQIDQIDPRGPSLSSGRVFRGGCWVIPPEGCQVAGRLTINSADRSRFNGFRSVLPPGQP
jgi:formylglycine-generating enzyme required for sulfatase activity